MIESIEGKRGMPRHRPPFVAQVGIFDRPTLVHNVETLYWVAKICREGPECLNTTVKNGRKGLRSYSVSGRVKAPGVYLLPAGFDDHRHHRGGGRHARRACVQGLSAGWPVLGPVARVDA
jgi:NADH:ubiquinone oxidoreductase subunit F (NADH-binding)